MPNQAVFVSCVWLTKKEDLLFLFLFFFVCVSGFVIFGF